jgi:hypothetical protein
MAAINSYPVVVYTLILVCSITVSSTEQSASLLFPPFLHPPPPQNVLPTFSEFFQERGLGRVSDMQAVQDAYDEFMNIHRCSCGNEALGSYVTGGRAGRVTDEGSAGAPDVLSTDYGLASTDLVSDSELA